jgi:hypothetical protein
VQVVDHILEGDTFAGGEGDHQVENGKGVAQSTIRFLCDQVQGSFFGLDFFAVRDFLQLT